MSSDNRNGVILFLSGLVALTLIGVGMSHMVRKQISWSGGKKSISEELSINARKLNDLRLEHMRMKTEIAEASSLRKQINSNIEKSHTNLALETVMIAQLKRRRSDQIRAIETMIQAYAEFRESYRKSAWRDAVGEKIDHIFLKTGQQLERVIIIAVTPTGLTVSHSQGNARIPFERLEKEYLERFQWDNLPAENAPQSDPLQTETPADEGQSPAVEEPKERNEDRAAKVNQLENAISAYRKDLISLESQYETAKKKNRYSDNRSVPGSLRTWEEQIKIVNQKLVRTNARLALAQEQLRQLLNSAP